MNLSNEEIQRFTTMFKKNDYTKSVENSKKILEIINKNKNLSIDKCPDEITLDMLKMEMDCADLRFGNYDINTLWKSYFITCFTKSKFGFYLDPNEEIDFSKLPLPEEVEEEEEVEEVNMKNKIY